MATAIQVQQLNSRSVLLSGCHRAPTRPAARCGGPGSWSDGPLFVVARGGHHARVLPDGLMLVWGGAKNVHVREWFPAESFDPALRRDGVGYDALPPEAVEPPVLTAPRGTPPLAALVRLRDGRLLAAGGAGPDGSPLRAVAIDGCPAAPMRSPRADAAAVLLPDGRVLVTGGRTGGPREMDPYIRSTELFTP